MYQYMFGLSILKSFTPYFRKHVLTTLNSHDLLFINTFFIFSIVFLFFLYKLFFDKSNPLIETFKNYKSLSLTQVVALFVMAFLAVGSSIFVYEFDKKYNTPLINSMFMRTASTISLILVGIFLFEEKYSWKQIAGVFFTIFGVYLISQK
uniref:EamA domain-containing protein n=1 Tax=viral metagenome TaxID=1070528 RepID=A0A6C0HCK1_9ZZZZ